LPAVFVVLATDSSPDIRIDARWHASIQVRFLAPITTSLEDPKR
jgi:hypothetical protein